MRDSPKNQFFCRSVCAERFLHSEKFINKNKDESLEGLSTIVSAELTKFRNSHQNCNVAVNGSKREIRTYLGVLKPDLANAGFSGSGEYSPLINDPYFRTMGTGTKIFLGGGTGWITGPGTQHCSNPRRSPNGVPMEGAGTISVRGDLRGMNPRYLRGIWINGYGVSLSVGVGIPIPILDEEMACFTGVSDSDILAPVVDYSSDYPENGGSILGHVNYRDLYSGEITVKGKRAKTFSISSRKMGEEIAGELKEWIERRKFTLSAAAETLKSM